MDMECLLGLMAEDMKAITKMIKSMEKGLSNGVIIENISAVGIMASSMGKDCMYQLMELLERENGTWVKG